MLSLEEGLDGKAHLDRKVGVALLAAPEDRDQYSETILVGALGHDRGQVNTDNVMTVVSACAVSEIIVGVPLAVKSEGEIEPKLTGFVRLNKPAPVGNVCIDH